MDRVLTNLPSNTFGAVDGRGGGGGGGERLRTTADGGRRRRWRTAEDDGEGGAARGGPDGRGHRDRGRRPLRTCRWRSVSLDEGRGGVVRCRWTLGQARTRGGQTLSVFFPKSGPNLGQVWGKKMSAPDNCPHAEARWRPTLSVRTHMDSDCPHAEARWRCPKVPTPFHPLASKSMI